MSDITFTFFKNERQKQGIIKIKPWSKWILSLINHEIRGQKSDSSSLIKLNEAKKGPCLVLGEVKKGENRSKKNVIAAYAIALDLENLSDNEIEKTLRTITDWEWFAYTTHKHKAIAVIGQTRLRVILPFREPVTPEDYPKAWQGLNELTGRVNDPQTKDISRLHFLPSTYDLGVAGTIHNEGPFISLEDLLPYYQEPQIEHQAIQSFESIRNKLNKIRKSDDLKEATTSLLKGEPFAEPSKRHDTVLALTMLIAQKDSTLPSNSISALFGPSLQAMTKAAPEAPTIKEVIKAYDGAVEKIKENLRNIQSRGKEKYNRQELEQIAKAQNTTVDDLEERWIIQRAGGGWVLDETGNYKGPFTRFDMMTAIRKYLDRAPVNLLTVIPSGGYKAKNMIELVEHHGNLAEHVRSDMSLVNSFFKSQTGTMYEAVTPVRTELKPSYNDQINTWLEEFAERHYMKLIDWMSVCSDLNLLLCAIYFDGPRGCGKNLFAHGMAKIWTEGEPADLGLVLSDFNETLVKCPLIFADEELPQKFRWQSVTPKLRSMLSTTERTLTRKHLPPSDLHGAIRLILAANNEFLLDTKEVSTRQDLDAIAQRFLYIQVSEKATKYLENDITKKTKRDWQNGEIAEHALYLAENHTVKEPGPRFEVEGDITQMHRLLMTGSHWNSIVCEWLVRYLNNPSAVDEMNEGLVKRQDGELLVNEDAIIRGWDVFFKYAKETPNTSKIAAALRAISKTSERKQLRWREKRLRYRIIDLEHLFSWSDRFNIGDKEAMKACVEGRVIDDNDVLPFKKQKQREKIDEEESNEY